MVIITRRYHRMLQAFVIVALLSLAMNAKLLFDVKQYQRAYDATVSSISYLSGQVTDLTGQLTQANKENKKLEQKVSAKQIAFAAASADAECLARNIYYEAGAESITGKMAVAFVTLNRMHNPAFPRSACGVVYQGAADGDNVCQFSWACSSMPAIELGSVAWEESKRIAARVLALRNKIDDPTNGSLYFHNGSVKPKWADKSRFVAKIDNHYFYR